MKTTLLIMAAGIGSRFGGGIKQLEPVDESGHIIMDYSIHDAIEAGFQKIVFIIRKDIELDFKAIIGNRIEKICGDLGVEVGYAFQAKDALPNGILAPENRTKPWGTGQAVLAAKDLVSEPFVVINADDYYGKEAFVKMHSFLATEAKPNEFCMAGFFLKNTLSENGGVTRGICEVDENGNLMDIVETSDIVKTDAGAMTNEMALDMDTYVSMNMWGLTPDFMKTLEDGFITFLENEAQCNPLKSEYLLPTIIGKLLADQEVSVKVLETKDKWFGVTYKEDKELVVDSFEKLISARLYQKDLFADL